jgi:DNA-directed RNA polymerase specialized sigma24 family protein
LTPRLERLAYFVQVARAITGDRERAIEAVQDAFVGLFKNRRGFRGDGPIRLNRIRLLRLLWV